MIRGGVTSLTTSVAAGLRLVGCRKAVGAGGTISSVPLLTKTQHTTCYFYSQVPSHTLTRASLLGPGLAEGPQPSGCDGGPIAIWLGSVARVAAGHGGCGGHAGGVEGHRALQDQIDLGARVEVDVGVMVVGDDRENREDARQ